MTVASHITRLLLGSSVCDTLKTPPEVTIFIWQCLGTVLALGSSLGPLLVLLWGHCGAGDGIATLTSTVQSPSPVSSAAGRKQLWRVNVLGPELSSKAVQVGLGCRPLALLPGAFDG